MSKQIVLIQSGGMDSAALLYHLLIEGYEVKCLGFNYGQRHKKELGYAASLCRIRQVEFKEVNLLSVKDLLGGSALTDDIDIPKGHYEDESMKVTVVPNRNMIMLSIAAGYAASLGFNVVGYAAHAGDHAIYPDCRIEFKDALQVALNLAWYEAIELFTPFIKLSKADIVDIGSDLGLPYELTWSCYEGKEYHCGTCGTCVERKEAFKIADVKDSTIYAETTNVI